MTVALDTRRSPDNQTHGLVTLIHREFFGHWQEGAALIASVLKALLIQFARLASPASEPRWSNSQQLSIYDWFRSTIEEHYREH